MNIDNLERNAELRNNLLSEAICKMQRELEAASKDESNPFFNSKYANLEAVVAACREPLFKNGLSVTQHLRIGESPYLETVLRHKSGEFITSECPLLFQKQDMQAMGSAITYARRYALAAICGIVTTDDDSDDDGAATTANQKGTEKPKAGPKKSGNYDKSQDTRTISEAQGKRLFAIMNKSSITEEQLREKMKSRLGVTSTEAIQRKDYDGVIEWLEKNPKNS